MVQAQAPFLCAIWHHDALGMVDQAQAIIAGTGAKEDMITITSSPGFWGEDVTPFLVAVWGVQACQARGWRLDDEMQWGPLDDEHYYCSIHLVRADDAATPG